MVNFTSICSKIQQMNKVYYLSTCTTCKRIMSEFDLNGFSKQDIKIEKISEIQLEEMKNISGTYESLFSRKSRQFRPLGLHEKSLSEIDYKNYILSDYTFLKRPVFIVSNKIFIGNDKNTVSELKSFLNC